MGELFLAEMIRPGIPPERVVIKRLLTDLQDEDKYVKMFRSEAAVMARLQHPNVVKLLDTPVIERAHCLAMEFVYGRNLHQILHRHERIGRPIPTKIALTIVAHVLRGLHYAHTFMEPDGRPLQLVHRDVTPGNVLVGYNGSVKLTDFGIAKSKMSLVSTTVGIVKGKARYLAPEQILGEPATPRSDIFSAAVVTVELLTREPLFERASLPKTLHAIVHGERPDLASQLPKARPKLVAILDRALSIEPRRRPPTAEAFAQHLLLAGHDYGGPANGPEVGGYLQMIFHDRAPLPPLGGDLEQPTITGPQDPTSIDRAPDDPIEEVWATDVGGAPTGEINALSETREGDALSITGGSGNGPTYILPQELPAELLHGGGGGQRGDFSNGIDDTASPSFNEAISALALVQSQQGSTTGASATPEAADASPPHGRPAAGWLVGSVGFVVGALVGVGATLCIQALFHSADGPRRDPPAAVPAFAPGPDRAPEASRIVLPDSTGPSPARATLHVLYPSSASVSIDGERLPGRVPIAGIELEPGPHTIIVMKGSYRRAHRVEVHAGDVLELDRALKRYSSSDPEGGDDGTSGTLKP